VAITHIGGDSHPIEFLGEVTGWGHLGRCPVEIPHEVAYAEVLPLLELVGVVVDEGHKSHEGAGGCCNGRHG